LPENEGAHSFRYAAEAAESLVVRAVSGCSELDVLHLSIQASQRKSEGGTRTEAGPRFGCDRRGVEAARLHVSQHGGALRQGYAPIPLLSGRRTDWREPGYSPSVRLSRTPIGAWREALCRCRSGECSATQRVLGLPA
jgi:hypothetical protein